MPMEYRNLIGRRQLYRSLISTSEISFGNQVKESKSSERKNTQMSLIFHLIFFMLYILVLLMQ